ncbi:hypothetical protein [Haloimpatiens massiliensis]|uniref:hypothetical protein n=1 Tax=Haloimpatiens massiliensis TaxID=1658110 RepID=UPI000C81EBE8|nr:hypothetical protein [Haloimpatiens massiliensis]
MPSDIILPKEYEIEGIISDNGKILKGDGFSVSHPYLGVYVVKFDHPFFYQAPEITIEASGLTQGATAMVIDKNLNAFKYFTLQIEPYDMYLQDLEINFSAKGLKN